MTKHLCIPRDPNSVIPTLHGLQDGESVVYHTGILAIDTYSLFCLTREQADIKFIAKVAMELSDAGKVYLTQRRFSGVFQYIATGKKRKANDATTNIPKEPEVTGGIY